MRRRRRFRLADVPRIIALGVITVADLFGGRYRRTEGAHVLATDADGRVLVVRPVFSGRDWMLPGGRVERGETPHVAAARETREETGLEVEVERLRLVDAHHARDTSFIFAGRVFRYAVATGRGESDPSAILRGALVVPKTKHHAAILDPKQLGELLRAMDSYSGHKISRLAMQVSPHVMTRPGELRMAVWSEFDLDNAVWKIPAERMKMRRPHEVPLSRQVLAYLRELYELTGSDGYVFPAFHTWRRPLSENTINQCFRRMGYAVGEVTAHGLRTTASTLLNESGKWSPDAIERSLAHADTNAIRGTYNPGRYWDERVAMHQWWSDYLDELRSDVSDEPVRKVRARA